MNWTLVIQIAVAVLGALAVTGVVGGIGFLLRDDAKSYPHTPGN